MKRILNLFHKNLVTETEESSRKKETKTKISKREGVKIKSETTSLETPSSSVLVAESKAFIAARRFVESLNNHNQEELIALLASNCMAHFKDAEISGCGLIEQLSDVNKSFPDVKILYEKIVDIGPNMAKLCNACSSGTHTGEPYGFGPFPPIAATGKKVLNDPDEIIITIDERTGLITKMTFVPSGRLSGPPGFYQQIGGVLF